MVIDGFSSEITPGDILCLLGPNGIGKTTLFKTILGFLPLLGGSIKFDGKDQSKYSIKEFAKLVGYVPQSHYAPFAFSVLDVVVMGRTAHQSNFGGPGKKDYLKALSVMERLDIMHLKDRVYTELSGGERQMVIIARALAQEPKFLMMDEPTSNLDFGNQALTLKTVKRLAKEGLGVIMTTHSPDQVFLCDAKVALLMPNNRFVCGSANEVIEEKNLFEAYAIQVAVSTINYKSQVLYCCQPILSDDDI